MHVRAMMLESGSWIMLEVPTNLTCFPFCGYRLDARVANCPMPAHRRATPGLRGRDASSLAPPVQDTHHTPRHLAPRLAVVGREPRTVEARSSIHQLRGLDAERSGEFAQGARADVRIALFEALPPNERRDALFRAERAIGEEISRLRTGPALEGFRREARRGAIEKLEASRRWLKSVGPAAAFAGSAVPLSKKK